MSVWTTQESGLPPLAAGWPETFARRFGAFALRARLVLALTGGLLAALAVLLILLPGRPPAPVVRDPGIGAWVRKPELAPRLAVRDPSLAGLPQSGALWSRPHGDRTDVEDRLTVGDMEGTGRFLLIAAARSAGDASDTSLFVASARLAANEGLAVSRFAAERPGGASRAGRFAPLETALVSLARVFPSGVSREACLAWRAPAGFDITLSGFVCPQAGQSVSETDLDCLLRDLVALPGADADLREALRTSPPGSACRSAPPAAAKTARRN